MKSEIKGTVSDLKPKEKINEIHYYQLGVAYRKEKNLTMAGKYFMYAAQQGHAPSQLEIGLLYHLGLGGLDEDQPEAIRFVSLSADQQYAPALQCLGIFYSQGKGVEKDLKKATELVPALYPN